MIFGGDTTISSKNHTQEQELFPNQESNELNNFDRSKRLLKDVNLPNIELIKKWLQKDVIILVLIALAVFILELLLGTFYDTTTHWDAWTRAQGAEDYAHAPFIYWIPFVEGSRVGLVWLPGHFYILGLLHRITGIPALYLGEILSAACTAGISCYLFIILREYLKIPQKRAILLTLLPLTSAYWLSYGSQCMTDMLGFFLLIATLFHFGKFILPNTNSRRSYVHGAIGIFLGTFSNLVRYEPGVIVAGIVGLLFLISVFLQVRRLINKRGWEKSLLQMTVKCVLFMILPASAVIIWLLYNYKLEGDFFYTTTWIMAHNANWGTSRLTMGSLTYTSLVFFSRLNSAVPFWWLVPLPLLVFILTPVSADKLNKNSQLWFFFMIGTSIFFCGYMFWQMITGVTTSETRFFLTLAPFTSIAVGFLSRHPRFRSNWLIASLFVIGSLSGLLTLQILHERHLFFVQQDPDYVKP